MLPCMAAAAAAAGVLMGERQAAVLQIGHFRKERYKCSPFNIYHLHGDHMSRIGFGGVAVVLKAKGPFAAFHVGEI